MSGSESARVQSVMKRLALLVALGLVGASCDAAASNDLSGSASPSGGPSASAAVAASGPPDIVPGTIVQEFPSGGPRNQVNLLNQEDGRFMARASIRLSRVDSGSVRSTNLAIAEGRCADCQTIAVALQVVLYKRGTSDVQPVNAAVAVNDRCTRCITVARAIQYAIPVDDPNEVPSDVRALINDMNSELRYFSTVKSLSEIDPDQAMARLNNVMQQYGELQQFLTQLQDAKQKGDTESSSPSPAAPSVTPTAAPPSGSASPSTSPAPSAP